ncbi:hypothetical protein BU23DRAFT_571985 [Bimuria novae-zelandiae CBS 107.79]|uniref:Uncharacterized protein n=1 Tax=Bimuria novae-zelandiae CBS 107.79 TaxID=1447943 RepID=A0A6A5UY86_9PLEO|nr:hypothetical protein BU23DRAFT_571985 [Bimuria novae-zelandiae CBS 107.79]
MPMAQSQRSHEFIPYTRPPDPKPAPRRIQLKNVPPSNDEYLDIDDFLAMELDWNTEGGNGEELAHKAHAVEAGDATCSDAANNEANYKIDSIRKEIVDVSSDNTTNKREDVSIPNTQEASQLPPSAGNSEVMMTVRLREIIRAPNAMTTVSAINSMKAAPMNKLDLLGKVSS